MLSNLLAQFIAHTEDDFVSVVSLQIMKFRDKYLAIRNYCLGAVRFQIIAESVHNK